MVFFNKNPYHVRRTFMVLFSSLALFASPFSGLQKGAMASTTDLSIVTTYQPLSWIETKVSYSKALNAIELEIGNMVSWSTKEEINNAYFVIQRSLDGVEFKNVLQLKGAGTSQEEQQYQWLDTRTGDMRVFYRLQQIGLDGNFYYSETIISNRIKPNNLLITKMSSPETDGLFSISLHSAVQTEMYYAVIDRSRHTWQEGQMSIVNGENLLTINISALDNQQYQVVFEAAGEIEQIYIQKVSPDAMPPLATVIKE